MPPRQRERSWCSSMRKEAGLDFCLWLLRIDGLPAAPFDPHPDGTRRLQAAGLTSQDWRLWLLRLLGNEREMRAIEDPVVWAAEATASSNPVNLWPGSAPLKERLPELWLHYEMLTAQLRRASPPQADAFVQLLTPRERRALWKSLAPLQRLLPTLDIYLVDDPQAPLLVYPPAVLVIGNRTASSAAQS